MSQLISCFFDPSTGKIYQSVQEEPKGTFVSPMSTQPPPSSSAAPPQPSSRGKRSTKGKKVRVSEKKQVRYLDEESDEESEESERQEDDEDDGQCRRLPKKGSKAEGGRKPSAWTSFCKDYATKNRMSYAAAISDPKCRDLYHRSK